MPNCLTTGRLASERYLGEGTPVEETDPQRHANLPDVIRLILLILRSRSVRSMSARSKKKEEVPSFLAVSTLLRSSLREGHTRSRRRRETRRSWSARPRWQCSCMMGKREAMGLRPVEKGGSRRRREGKVRSSWRDDTSNLKDETHPEVAIQTRSTERMTASWLNRHGLKRAKRRVLESVEIRLKGCCAQPKTTERGSDGNGRDNVPYRGRHCRWGSTARSRGHPPASRSAAHSSRPRLKVAGGPSHPPPYRLTSSLRPMSLPPPPQRPPSFHRSRPRCTHPPRRPTHRDGCWLMGRGRRGELVWGRLGLVQEGRRQRRCRGASEVERRVTRPRSSSMVVWQACRRARGSTWLGVSRLFSWMF